MSKPKPKDKPFAIPKQLVWEAYRQVAANKGAPGVDGQTLEEFEADLENNLYKIWNRMSSGSYFPPPVKAVEIPKPHSPGVRVLGVPTVADRVAQTVVAMFLEPLVEPRFHRDSYGYRPGSRPMTRSRCAGGGAGSTTGSSISMSRSSSTPFPGTSWFVRCRRSPTVRGCCCTSSGGWLHRCSTRTVPLLSETRELRKGRRFRRSWRTCSCTTRSIRGWPGSHPGCPFERYADDAVVHCKSRRQAELVLAGIAARMAEVGLRLHPDKTRIVYCKDSNRRGEHEHTSFTFLGYTFRPREAINRKEGEHFTAFSPAISPEALKAKGDRLRELRIHRHTNLSLDDLAGWLNPIVAGWMNYYGRYYRSALYPLLRRVSLYLRRWAGKKYKRLRTYKRFKRWWTGLLEREPGLFAHWQWVRAY